MTEEFERVASMHEVPEGRGISRVFRGEEVALYRVGDTVYAILNLCPHQHVPTLADAPLEGTLITCPMHGWSFDLVTCRSVAGGGRLEPYDVRIERGEILLRKREEEVGTGW